MTTEEKRSVPLTVMLTPAEHALVSRTAAETFASMSSYARSAIVRHTRDVDAQLRKLTADEGQWGDCGDCGNRQTERRADGTEGVCTECARAYMTAEGE